MDPEKLREMFEKHEDEHLKFERIPESSRLNPSRTLCAYLKVQSLMYEPEKFDIDAEHDIVFLPDCSELRELSEADVVYLWRCGVHFDDEVECLADFC